jgi:hypothetical protein
MESPRIVNRFFLTLLITCIAIAAAASIYFAEVSILLRFIAALALIAVFLGLIGIINAILLAPFLWLLSRLTPYIRKGSRLDRQD